MPRFRFGCYVLDSDAGVLTHGDQLVDIRPKLVETLIPLVEAAPGVVSKEALVQRVWRDTHVVESGLLRNISELRQWFAAEFGDAVVIETVSKRGYRFAIPVTCEPVDGCPEETPAAASGSRRVLPPLRPVLVGAAIVLVFAVIGLSRLRENQKDSSAIAAAKSEQVAKSRDLAKRTFQAGFALYDHWTVESMAKAENQFRQTIRLLPDDWFGYQALASALVANAVLSGAGFPDDGREARNMSELALSFGPQVAVTHAVRGAVLLLADWNWREAEREIDEGIGWNPKNWVPLAYRGALRVAQGRPHEAVRDFDSALQLNPKYDEAALGKAIARYYAGDFAGAASLAQATLSQTKKRHAAFQIMTVALGAQNRFAEAGEALRQSQAGPVQRLQTESWLAAREGRRALALDLRTQFENQCRAQRLAFCDTAAIDVALGKHGDAIDSVAAAVRMRHWKALFLTIDPLLKPLHRDPRWAEIAGPLGRR